MIPDAVKLTTEISHQRHFEIKRCLVYAFKRMEWGIRRKHFTLPYVNLVAKERSLLCLLLYLSPSVSLVVLVLLGEVSVLPAMVLLRVFAVFCNRETVGHKPL